MTYEEGKREEIVSTLIGKSKAIRGLLGESVALTHTLVGAPLHNESVDNPEPTSSLEILENELWVIQERARILFEQLERIRDAIGAEDDGQVVIRKH